MSEERPGHVPTAVLTLDPARLRASVAAHVIAPDDADDEAC